MKRLLRHYVLDNPVYHREMRARWRQRRLAKELRR